MLLAIKCPPARLRATPLIARLSPSEPPLVNTIRRAVHPSSRATCRRASSTRRRAETPTPWMLDGLAEVLRGRRVHRLPDRRVNRRRGVVVEIDEAPGLDAVAVGLLAADLLTCRHRPALAVTDLHHLAGEGTCRRETRRWGRSVRGR